jgi:hypothetical protein
MDGYKFIMVQDGTRPPCGECFVQYLGADLEHPRYLKEGEQPKSYPKSSAEPVRGVGLVMTDWDRLKRGPKMLGVTVDWMPRVGSFEAWERREPTIMIRRGEISRCYSCNERSLLITPLLGFAAQVSALDNMNPLA